MLKYHQSRQLVSIMIKKIKGKFELYSKDGTKHLGSFATKEEAQAREDEINKIKHAKEPTGNQQPLNQPHRLPLRLFQS